MEFISNLQKSLTDLNHGLGKALIITVLDALFIISSAFIFSSLFRSIWEQLMKLLAFFFSKKEPDAELQQFITDLTTKQDVMNLIANIAIKATIFFFVLALVWTIFQTIIWHIAKNITSKSEYSISLTKYGLRIFSLNLVFAPIIYIILAITIQLSYGTKIQAALIAGGFSFVLSQQIILWSGVILVLICSIAMHISYVYAHQYTFFKNLKKSLLTFKKKWLDFITAVIFIGIALFVSHQLQALLSGINITIMFLFGFLLDFGILVLFRLLIVNTVLNKKKHIENNTKTL